MITQKQQYNYYFFFFREPAVSPATNYRLTDEYFDSKSGAKTRYRNNVAAIRLLQKLEITKAAATPDQQNTLAKYIGWGGLAQVFDSHNTNWSNEYNELKSLLSPNDYILARESVLSAFYTSKTVIDGIYEGLRHLGFVSGTVLEPAMGIGNFVGLVPDDFAVDMHGVEIDNITGKIAKYLYPNANIQITGFERTGFADNTFDAVVTNVPFGSFKVYDKDYAKYNLFIHDYFILKSLDKLRVGGIAAIVTSKGTMDKTSGYVRSLFAKRAELLGAIRLPNNAFKTIAGTEVTTDILFLQKVDKPQQNPVWLDIGTDTNGVPINNYYIANPHMVLGAMTKGKSMYGNEDETACVSDGRCLQTAILQAVSYLPSNIYTLPAKAVQAPEPNTVRIPAANELRLNAMLKIKDIVRYILDTQVQGCTDEILTTAQEKLNNLYDRFVLQYGYLNSKVNRKLVSDNTDYALLLSIENYDELKDTATKTDIFSKRTIRRYTRPTRADTALEALHICKNETGRVDMSIIQQLIGKSINEIVTELDGHIYRNPVGGYETASEYLSGNVVAKLRLVKSLVQDEPQYQINIDALSKIQPIPLTASEISVRIGVPWIKADYYKQFIVAKFKLTGWSANELSVDFNKFTMEWRVEGVIRNFQSTDVFGTSRMNGYRVFEHALNLRTPSVYDTIKDSDGKERRVLNKSETIAAREKLRILQEEFKSWIFDCPVRRHELVELYNNKFNNIILAKYDGSYLDFPEMNHNIELKPYQKDAVERIITSGNTLLHHVVGAGKTFEVAATAMKLRQLKLANKPMIVVPNHLVLQWAHEFRTLYPNAKLLITTKRDFEKEHRLKFVSRIATNDWDAVVIAMSSFERLPISMKRQERKIAEEITAIECAITEINHDRSKRGSVKDLQRVLKNKRAILESLSNSAKDNLIEFEQLGVDYLFIDEAHKYKNKFIFTKMNNVAGISRAMSKRATDLDMKIDYIMELHGGKQKGVVFATGTPISNSMTEMYTMQSYLAKNDLREAGLLFFDDWAAVFGETVTALELAPSGQGYRTKTRFARFVNLPEMLKMYRKFADVKTADMLKLPVPKANKKVITIKPTEEVLRLSEIIVQRAEAINAGAVRPEVDNMLKITSDGKKLALDPRCFDASASDDYTNKVNVCIREVYRVWDDTKDKRLTQLIFCDLSTPKCSYADYDPSVDFDVYNHVKFGLVSMGVPANEIAYIHDANTDTAKQVLFDSIRSGKVRILLGSTEKCGAGTNVQNKLIAIHHLDTPYRPSDMEQREGRGIRQGNKNSEIDIYTYVTERTFDAYSYQILENKQRFISQVNKGDFSIREAGDIDETTFNYAEIKAITSANPLIKRKNEVEVELSQLRVLQQQHRNSRYMLQDRVANYLPRAIEHDENIAASYIKDIQLRDNNLSQEFSMTVANRIFTERKQAAELYHQLACTVSGNKCIGSVYGFELFTEITDNLLDKVVSVKAHGSYRVAISDSPLGSLTRLENFFKNMELYLNQANATLEERKSELTSALLQLDKPFEHEQAILALSSELAEIEAELDLDKAEVVSPIIEEENDNKID